MNRTKPILSRRRFMAATMAACLAPCLVRDIWGESKNRDLQHRTLGRTGEKVSPIGLGGFHIGKQSREEESIRIIRSAIDNGITFMDNCWDYNDGQSEIRMGKALQNGYRQKVFLMSKIDGRDKRTAARQIDDSLRRLGTDRVDLMQFHEIIRPEDPGYVFAPGGALEAMLEARQAGKIRYIGFTGHKSPVFHQQMLTMARKHEFRFDAVQMPLNVMDAHYNSFEKNVLPELVRQEIGVLGMKPLGGQYIATGTSLSPIECLHYAMNLPTSVVITGIDSMEILRQALKAARTFRPMGREQVAALLAKAHIPARKGEYELYKTSHTFDGTYRNPEWLGPKASGTAPAVGPQAGS